MPTVHNEAWELRASVAPSAHFGQIELVTFKFINIGPALARRAAVASVCPQYPSPVWQQRYGCPKPYLGLTFIHRQTYVIPTPRSHQHRLNTHPIKSIQSPRREPKPKCGKQCETQNVINISVWIPLALARSLPGLHAAVEFQHARSLAVNSDSA